MFDEISKIPVKNYSFQFSGHRWEVRKDEEGFFLEDEHFSLKQFLLTAAAHMYHKRERKIFKDFTTVFPKISGTIRSEVALAQERTILPDFPLTEGQRQELEALGGALKWLLDVSTKSTDIARTWQTYQRVYGKEDLYGAAYHLCCYGRPPSYRNPPVESNTLVEITLTSSGVSVKSPESDINYKRVILEAVSAAILYERKNKGGEDYSEEARTKVFASRIYSAYGYRVSLSQEAREAVFKMFSEINFDYLSRHPEANIENFFRYSSGIL